MAWSKVSSSKNLRRFFRRFRTCVFSKRRLRAVRFAPILSAALVLATAGARPLSADGWEHFKQATKHLDAEEVSGVSALYEDVETSEENPWLPPARNVDPRRRRPKAGWSFLERQLYCCSYPASPPLQSVLNPWGEQVQIYRGPVEGLACRILAACEVYRYQRVHFDGYLGSEDDGRHLFVAADGRNVAWFGDNEAKTYRAVPQSLADTLDERCWICVDLPVFAINLAGFPIRQAMVAHFLEAPELYTKNWAFPDNAPVDVFFFRRVENVRTYFRCKQFYSDDHIAKTQYFDPDYRPPAPFRPGDLVFMGHYFDEKGKGPFEEAKHSGIVANVDERGLPVWIYNMRTSNRLIDRYDGLIAQTRIIKGRPVYFRRFCDRYSIIGHGRIVNPFRPEKVPTIEMVRAFLDERKIEEATSATATVVLDRQTASDGTAPASPPDRGAKSP